MPSRSMLFLLMLSLALLPGCPTTDDDDSAANDDDATSDDDDATSDDDDATGDDDDATGDDDDATGDDDDSAGDDDDSAGDDDDSAPVDGDGDGSPEGEDCDDNDATSYPGAIEECGSGVDEDCDPSTNCDDTCLPRFDFATSCNLPAPALSPVVHWDYESETAGVISDSGTSSTSGTWTGTPAHTPGFWGNGATFDGTNWILAGAALTLPTDTFTFVTWVKADIVSDNNSELHFLMSSGNGSPGYTGAGIFLTDGEDTRGLLEAQNSAWESLPTGPTICDSKWTQVALVFDQGTANIYVDGAVATSTTPFTDVVWGARPFGVANDPNNLGRFFVGEMDESKVYGSALSANDVDTMRAWELCNRP
ncbi:MAG: hypothetical protein KDA24_09665 [Deltaproteobacteria bacterium]|nr:hypothetical protein [Deltaproteobacteria bacterium]